MKEIILGTYKYDELNNFRQKTSGYGGTDSWDIEIKKNGLLGKELELILRPKKEK